VRGEPGNGEPLTADELRALAGEWAALRARYRVQTAELVERRAALLRRRRAEGASLRAIAAEAGLTASGVKWLLGDTVPKH